MHKTLKTYYLQYYYRFCPINTGILINSMIHNAHKKVFGVFINV